MASYLSALGVLFQPMNFIMMYLCSLVGCVLGAIPGLSGGLGITLILPMTFALNTNLSFAMLLGMYVGGVSGSFIAAVLVGIPGSAASIGTCYDGYPMTQKGQAARALTIGITGSFIGTLVSIIVATLCSTFIADVALMLGPWEYFSLCLMAITMVVGLSNGSIFKGLLASLLITTLPVSLLIFTNHICNIICQAFTDDITINFIVQINSDNSTSSANFFSGWGFAIFMLITFVCVIKVFLANIKRGGILIIQIFVGSLHLFNVPR